MITVTSRAKRSLGLAAATLLLAAPTASAEPITALTTTNGLITFDSAAPGSVSAVKPVTGLDAGDSLIAVDRHLIGLGSQCGGDFLHNSREIVLGRLGIPLGVARAEGEQLTMGALTEQVALTSGGVTRLLDRMIKAGYVERRQCPTDRRVVYAALTSAGRGKIDEAARVHARDLEQVFASFSPEERHVLDGLLDRLRPGTLSSVIPGSRTGRR